MPANSVITGIPRSGTSYLCRLLHSVENCVVINEPRELYQRLQQAHLPEVAQVYSMLRTAIERGEAIENKVSAGQVIEDTRQTPGFAWYHPTVTRPDFLLLTKNTLGYLARLPQIIELFAPLPIIACVRHPVDTIASWKNSFTHLSNAAVSNFVTGSTHDELLSPWQRDQLVAIAAEAEVMRRRAMLWRYLAEWLWQQRESLLWVSYEESVQFPQKTVQTLLTQFHLPPQFTQIPQPSSLRLHRHEVSAAEIAIIKQECEDIAQKLGYIIEE
jgi:hypothetical protein